ncbi:MAG TPA: hypothetical protein VGV67_05665 [Solirubrobacteraceae bacterium]|nr:hypothetical protein [Solirubrobacteraceae bacterium]
MSAAPDDASVVAALRATGAVTRALALVSAALLVLGLDVVTLRVADPAVVVAPLAVSTTTDATPRSAPTVTAAPRPVPFPSALPTATPSPPSPLVAYEGLGAWVDVFDYALPYQMGVAPEVTPDEVEVMAATGVRTLFIQTARMDPRSPGMYADEPTLRAFIATAHEHGLRVVGWYLPTLVDIEADLARLEAMSDLVEDGAGLDGIAVDIEARDVADVDERNRRLIALSQALRASRAEPIGAIVLPPVVIDEINTGYWPRFPWAELAPLYDVWLPMAYWTNRPAETTYRDPALYTAENARRVRAYVGAPDAPVHIIGGIGDATTAEDLRLFVPAADEAGAIGLSLYDWATADLHQWQLLGEVTAANT